MAGIASSLMLQAVSLFFAVLTGFAFSTPLIAPFLFVIAGVFLWLSDAPLLQAGNLSGVFFINRIYNKAPMKGKNLKGVCLVLALLSLVAPVGSVALFGWNAWYALMCSFLAGIALASLAFTTYHCAYREAIRRNLILSMESEGK